MKWVFVFACLVSEIAHSQSIEGVVRDGETGEVIPFANVYLAGTLKGTSTDIEGAFSIWDLKSGTYDLAISHVGFRDTVLLVTVQREETLFLRLQLNPETNLLPEIFVNADTAGWKNNFYAFKNLFLGTTENSSHVIIKNPVVLSLYFDPKDNILFAHAKNELIIENHALGYRIFYKLKKFEANMNSGLLMSFGIPRFEQMASTKKAQIRKWEKARLLSYSGSFAHFLTALKDDRLTKEGFFVQEILRIKNKDRPAQKTIDQKMAFFRKRLKTQMQNGKINLGEKSSGEFDSLQYWTRWNNSSEYFDSLGSVFMKREQLLEHSDTLNFQGILKVVYLKEKEELNYRRGMVRDHRQTSLVHFLGEEMILYENGNYDSNLILLEQYLAWHSKLAEMLPLDYEPNEN